MAGLLRSASAGTGVDPEVPSGLGRTASAHAGAFDITALTKNIDVFENTFDTDSMLGDINEDQV